MDPLFKSSKKYSFESLKRNSKASRPVVLSQDIPPGTKFTFVDISHSLATIDSESKWNEFGALVDTANNWLKRNFIWKLESCETVLLSFKDEKLDPGDYGATKRLIRSHICIELHDYVQLKSLRLWLSRRAQCSEWQTRPNVQNIKYKTFLPKSTKLNDGQIVWEELKDVMKAINEAVISGQIKGKVLNIESVNYCVDENWDIDTESPKQFKTAKLETILRLYYDSNEAADAFQEFLAFDFVPEFINLNPLPKFEPYNILLCKVQEFLEDNQQYKFVNLQSLDIKFKNIDEFETHFMINVNDTGYYLRVIRLICVKASGSSRLVKAERQDTERSENMEHLDENVDNIEESQTSSLYGVFRPEASVVPSNQTIGSVLNIKLHNIEITNQSTIHGPFYSAKKAIEEFMKREEWYENREHQKWNYLYAQTIEIIARNDFELAMKTEMCLYNTKLSFLSMPRLFSVVRIYFDNFLIDKSRRTKSEFDKYANPMQTLQVAALSGYHSSQYLTNTSYPGKDKVTRSTMCQIV